MNKFDWDCGFSYASNRLNSIGDSDIAYLESNVEKAKDFGDYTLFDKGVEAAIAKYQGKCYFSYDGTLLNADGTRSIFDDVDK